MKYWFGVASAFIVTAALDHFFSRAIPGVVLAEPTTIIAVSASIAAATAVTTGALNYVASQDAADKAKELENQQRDQLKAASDAASQQAAAQAVSGQTFGEDSTAKAAATGLGFQPTGTNAGAGRAALTGMN